MATKFVYSAAAGANDGTSWADAWTSLASASGVAAGDVVKVHKTHSQTGLGANINWSNGTTANPVRIVCVDKDASDALATGASVEWTTTGLGPQGEIYAYGMTWKSTQASLAPTSGTDGRQTHESCTFVVAGATGVSPAGTRSVHVWRNCTLDFSGASSTAVGLNGVAAQRFEWIGGTYTIKASQVSLVTSSNPIAGAGGVVIRGVVVSGSVTNVCAGASFMSGWLVLTGCTLPGYTNVVSTVGNGQHWFVALDNCAAGTITVPALGPTLRQTREGTVGASLARYRTGGSDDGEQANAYSWAMVTNANAGTFADSLLSPPVTRWVDTGGQTVTVYVASGVTLKDDEFWIEVLSPSEAGSPTAQAKYQSTRAAALATPANLTTDGDSTWNGAGVGTKQKVSVSINPTVAGPVVVRAHLAKASTTVYVDPKLDVA